MKATYLQLASAVALTFGIAACVPSTPAPAPAPVARPAPAPAAVGPTQVAQAPVFDSWMDVPATPGIWRYSSEQTRIGVYSKATFITADGAEAFAVACAFGDNMGLQRRVRTNRNLQMTVRTETATVSRLVPPDPEGQPLVNAVVAPSDPLLDAMALSKGRFAVEVEGLPTLYLLSWAEVSRVIEDCR